MLTKSFLHIKGITPDFEQLLREKGIKEWDDFLEKMDLLNSSVTKTKLDKIKNALADSKQALENKDLDYFKGNLKPKELWRLSDWGKIAFVDIETTGLSRWSDKITLIGIHDGMDSHIFMRGKNLDDAHNKLKEFDVVVTFNGKQFDIPFIETHFSCKYDFVHLDLRYMLKEFGLAGGLKSIESQLGIDRGAELAGVDGFEAVALWHRYQRGNQAALDKLLRYLEQDIVNLKALLRYYLEKKQGLSTGTV